MDVIQFLNKYRENPEVGHLCEEIEDLLHLDKITRGMLQDKVDYLDDISKEFLISDENKVRQVWNRVRYIAREISL